MLCADLQALDAAQGLRLNDVSSNILLDSYFMLKATTKVLAELEILQAYLQRQGWLAWGQTLSLVVGYFMHGREASFVLSLYVNV